MTNRRILAAAALGSSLAVSAGAQVPAGGEFTVSHQATLVQFYPVLTVDGGGGFVVAWERREADNYGFDVFAQRFGPDGGRRGSEFRVNTYATGLQLSPAIASDAAGHFIVTWTAEAQDGSLEGVNAQRYDAAGTARGGEFQVNAFTTSYQRDSSVASTPGGDFVVSWISFGQDGDGWGVIARRFASSGAPRGVELVVNPFPTFNQIDPFVSVDPAGRFVVAWSGFFADGSGYGVMARQFDASGVPAPQMLVNSGSNGNQSQAAIAGRANGDFVVVWTSATLDPGLGIAGQRFTATGIRLGGEFRANVYTTGNQTKPSVASDEAGNFVVTWTSLGEDGSGSGVIGRRYDAAGTPRGAPFLVNTVTSGIQSDATVASDAVGNFVVVWEGQVGSAQGIFGQRFGGLLPAALRVDTAAGPGSDGNGVLEAAESVDVQPSWRNVNGATLTFGGSAAAFTGPATGGPVYTLHDGTGAYGTAPDGATLACSDCYSVGITFGGTRPAVHWDATLTEQLAPDALGQTKLWPLHVGESFADVPRASPYYRAIETLLHRGVTAGCSGNAYCPGTVTTREQMAAFVLLAREGAGYAPDPCAPPNLFLDVPETSPFCDVIEELARRGVVSGCGGGFYCPTAPVPREQMPVFVLRTLDPALNPPACTTPLFVDVPATSPFCRWIEELARRGVVTGCGGGNYCPASPVTREQMAVFLAGTFGLTLYGP
jgi:hypothetical protein